MVVRTPAGGAGHPGSGSGDSNGNDDDDCWELYASAASELAHTKSALANICRHAPTKSDLLNLGSVNSVFHEVASSEHVWDRLYAQDFPHYHDCLVAQQGVDASAPLPYIPWYSEYRSRWHKERCWETGNLTRKAPVILSGHMGCVFGACFLGAPFTQGTICTGAHIHGGVGLGDRSAAEANSSGEIKMWLPSRGTAMEQIVREFESAGGDEGGACCGGESRIPEGMDVETFTKQEIARAVRVVMMVSRACY